MRVASEQEKRKHCKIVRDQRVRFDNYTPAYSVGDTVRLRGNINSPCMVVFSFKTSVTRVPGIREARIWNGIYIVNYITKEITTINGNEVVREVPMRVEYHVEQLEKC